ncbi:MAG: sensor histidine kinase [Chitinophagaceae bacterium]|nr:sensor histidine kinase [Chitinophagaceae bacterium]
MTRYLVLLFLFLSETPRLLAHEDSALSTVLTGNVVTVYDLPVNMHVFIDTNQNTPLQKLRGGMFLHMEDIPGQKIAKRYMIDGYIYLLFWIDNDEMRDRNFYFSAGSFAKDTELFLRHSTSMPWVAHPKILPPGNELAYWRLNIEARREIQLLVKVKFIKSTVAQLKPVLIDINYYRFYINEIHSKWYGLDIITYVMAGIMLMMALFSLANYLQNFSRQYLYYSVYAFCMALLLFLKAITYQLSNSFTFFYEEYLDYVLLIVGYIFYIGFTRMFLSTPKLYPLLNRLFITAEIILAIFLGVFSWFYFTNARFTLLDNIENASKYFMIFLGLIYIVLGLIQRNKLMNYLVAGNIATFIFSGISQFIIVSRSSLIPSKGLFRLSLFYFEIGIFLELVLFLLGLVYKNKIELIEKVQMEELLKQQKERQEYEKQIAVLSAQQDERIRISADMHDELGSGVTAIRLLSEIAMQKTKEHPVGEIARISNNANELMSKMNGIIWSMNPGNDTLSSTISYIRANASEYLENFGMKYNIHVPSEIPDMELSGGKRRNLFLVVKESLNNILKHAKADEVTIDINCNHELEIKVSDNGKGIDPVKLNEFGNGLKNMQRRMESIGGTFAIESGKGTTVIFKLPMSS